MNRLTRWLILAHRYLGIALGLLFIMWFVSGIGMIYAGGMPELSGATRLERRPPLDLSRVRIGPFDAGASAGVPEDPGRVTLLTVLDRPAYRFGSARPVTVFADTGELLPLLSSTVTRSIAARFVREDPSDLIHAGVLMHADQWTLAERRRLPLHKFTVNDAGKTELYVSPRLGEVVLLTTRQTRMLAWVSAIPHWLYFTALRSKDGLWRQMVIVLAGLGTVAVFIGLVLGVIQFRVAYRGWLRWHYISGVTFGIVTLTWVFSGLLSMEPWFWAEGGAVDDVPVALSGGHLDLSSFPAIEADQWRQVLDGRAPQEIELLQIQGKPYYAVRGIGLESLIFGAQPLKRRHQPFSQASILDRVRSSRPQRAISDVELLPGFDAYYFSRHVRPAPVLRIKLDDPARTWLYVEPATSRLVASFSRRQRLQRWIYHGLHSLDFPFLYRRRPLWDIVIVALSLGGTLLSTIGVVIGFRRLKRSGLPAVRHSRPHRE